MNSDIHEMIERGKKYLLDKEYSEGAKRLYNDSWKRFKKYCKDKNITAPTRNDGKTFLTSRGISLGAALPGWHTQQERHIRCLFDIWENGKCPLKYARKRIPLPACFSNVHEAYNNTLEIQGLAFRTVYSKNHSARKFLNYLDSVGIYSIKDIHNKNVYEYISMIKSLQTKSYVKFFLREFLCFLVDNFDADSCLANLFPVILENKKDTLPSVYSAEELSAAYAHIDTGSRCAKRDRAILLLALQLGMRAGDITSLRHEYVDWHLRKLSFTQQKTKREIILPLPEECMYAILDYLKNERPVSDDPHIFLTSRAPYKPFAIGNAYHMRISACYERAKVNTTHKHRGLHSVRHSMAVNMLLTDTPYPVITGVLGHESSNTTKAYLRVDVERLRSLCLEVPHGS